VKSFEYAAPSTLRDALGLLSKNPGETEILAGGTDLITCLKQGITHPKRLVSLRQVKDLQGIASSPDGLRIGAMTTLRQVVDHAFIREKYPSIVSAITGVGSPQLLAVGTLGGDLCQRPRCWYFRNGFGLTATKEGTSLVREGQNQYHAIFGNEGPALFVSASSLGPVLVALGATITIAGPEGNPRKAPAAEFFRTPKSDTERETVLKPEEILTEIVIPDRGLKNATYEIRHRHGLDWPYVTASVAFRLENGTATDARIVLGHVAPVPWAAREGARALESAQIDVHSATRAGEAAIEGAQPLSQNAYKTQLVRTAVKRAVLAAAGQG
jgi:xanthine dehydrogenase YagS FAD-binding subunit